MNQEELKEVLFYAYKLGYEEADMKLVILIEEIKKRFEAVLEIK